VRDLQLLMIEPALIPVDPVPEEQEKAVVEIVAEFNNIWEMSKVIWIIAPVFQVVWHFIIWGYGNA
jgi:hypothetical protein